MKRALCVVVVGLMLCQAHAWQHGGRGVATQAAAPAAAPASTPSAGTPLSSPAPAVPPETALPSETSIDSALQTQIQDALDKDPIFRQGRLKVALLAGSIELSGEVASRADRQNAVRMAQSYARGKKVVNHIVIKGHNAQPGSNSPENLPANFSIPSGKNNRP